VLIVHGKANKVFRLWVELLTLGEVGPVGCLGINKVA